MFTFPLKSLSAAVIGVTLLTSSAFAVTPITPSVLTVYTYDGFASDWGPGPALKEIFEQDCNCTINFVGAEDAISALRRVQLEGAATSADVIVGLDTATAGQAEATGLFAEHGLTLEGLSLPTPYTSPLFTPFDYGYFAFVYNENTMPNPPTNFEELIALDDDVKIVIQDPRSSTPGLGLILWIQAAYGDRAAEIWEGLAPHVLTVTPGWSESYSLFLSGEADMVLSYTTSPAYHIVADDEHNYKAASFTEGHYTQIELSGILKSSQNQALAQEFLAFLASPQAADILPETNWMFPVTTPSKGLHAAFAEMIDPAPALLLPAEDVNSNTQAWIEQALGKLR